jgi:hypothetical protein
MIKNSELLRLNERHVNFLKAYLKLSEKAGRPRWSDLRQELGGITEYQLERLLRNTNKLRPKEPMLKLVG